MKDLASLTVKLATNPKKAAELAAFHWCMVAAGVQWDGLEDAEQPDFIMSYHGKNTGVEVTEAHRSGVNGKNTKQIEAAQEWFANRLLKLAKPSLPIEIGLCCEDNTEVDKLECEEALDHIVSLINSASAKMNPHSVILLVRSHADIPHSKQPKIECPEIPRFIQHIQILNGGNKTTSLTTWRSAFVENLTQNDVGKVIAAKEQRLENYASCDEHWLLIISGLVPPICGTENVPDARYVSLAKSFAGVDFKLPIKSKFDRMYFFLSPTEAILLTEQPPSNGG